MKPKLNKRILYYNLAEMLLISTILKEKSAPLTMRRTFIALAETERGGRGGIRS
jgi:hypothetical protein